MKKFYGCVSHHSFSRSSWFALTNAKTVDGAKRIMTREHGNGFIGHALMVVECEESEYERINDMPRFEKIIGTDGWIYNQRY